MFALLSATENALITNADKAVDNVLKGFVINEGLRKVHKYGDNVDTDVIIPARYLNTADHKELAAHCMEDIDVDFVKT